jgi:hypothetical protein
MEPMVTIELVEYTTLKEIASRQDRVMIIEYPFSYKLTYAGKDEIIKDLLAGKDREIKRLEEKLGEVKIDTRSYWERLIAAIRNE